MNLYDPDVKDAPLTDEENALIRTHLGLAFTYAGYWCRRLRVGIHTNEGDDLLSLAMAGLVKAARHYRPEKGSFSNYVAWQVRGQVSHHVQREQLRRQSLPPRSFLEDTRSLAVGVNEVFAGASEAAQLFDERQLLDHVLAVVRDMAIGPKAREYLVGYLRNYDTPPKHTAIRMGVTGPRMMHVLHEFLPELRRRLIAAGINPPHYLETP